MEKRLEKEIYGRYLRKGQAAAFALAIKHNIEFEYCAACETESPVNKNHQCLICGQLSGLRNEAVAIENTKNKDNEKTFKFICNTYINK